MRMKRNLAILGLVIIAVAAVLWWNQSGGEADRNDSAAATSGAGGEALKVEPVEGSLAPSFSLATIDEQTQYDVGGPRDKALIINFWASWCGPCDLEAPDLQAIYDKYKDKLDLYAVNATKYDTVRGAKDFVKEKQITFPVIMDTDNKAGDLYKVYSYPISFIIDKNGVVRERIEGIQPLEKWEDMIREVVDA
ncbi:TlpA family protein disulfide reductase [Cohnella algarum]|uniref:TlpA family protein disulfide reductase n=1 Tax=Cohnella algarum TaxID=2044859 RepID=UPI0019684F6B|nr:TlpA disulfide reductase family protein [Cohnella algarum]MBN2984777.1 redoxin domain-containing protein [Cohnella algarum]